MPGTSCYTSTGCFVTKARMQLRGDETENEKAPFTCPCSPKPDLTLLVCLIQDFESSARCSECCVSHSAPSHPRGAPWGDLPSARPACWPTHPSSHMSPPFHGDPSRGTSCCSWETSPARELCGTQLSAAHSQWLADLRMPRPLPRFSCHREPHRDALS